MHKITQLVNLPKPPLFRTKLFLVASSFSDFETLIKCSYPYILTSIWFKDKLFARGVKSFKELFEYFDADVKDYEIFVDSGSYSITAGGHAFTDKEIYAYLDNYIEFIYQERENISLYCNLDLQFNVDKSKEYYRYLCANGLHDSIQVHHRPERLSWLGEIVEKYTDPDRTVIALSPQPMCSPTIKYEYVRRCMSLFPNMKVHLLGSIDYKILRSFNIYSADSSGASRLASTGAIRTFVGTFDMGDRRSDRQHIYNQKPEKIKALEDYLNTLGYSIDELTGNDLGVSRKRLEVTILSYKDMMNKIEKNKNLVQLASKKEILKLEHSDVYASWSSDGTFPKKGEWK